MLPAPHHASASVMRFSRSLLFGLATLVPVSVILGQPTATEIIEASDALMRGTSQSGVHEITIVRPDWQRTLKLESWSEGTDNSFIRILEPAKDRGVSFLKIKREMWQYVPKINRAIKIPPSMMLQSWMGTDLTNDDLVKESSIVEDYTHRLLGQEEQDGQPVYQIELKAKPDAPVTWDRVVEWIRVADAIPVRAVYYNERGEPIRTLVFSDIKRMGKRTIPTRTELIDEKKPGHKTILVTLAADFDAPIPKGTFTQQNLRRARR